MFGVFLAASAVGHASIIYSAYISCGNCVTVSVSWFSEPQPVYYAEVDDNSFNPLFVLNVFPPSTTGSINPNPQTISGLPPSTLSAITGGRVVTDFTGTVSALSSVQGEGGPILALWDQHHTNIIDSVPFVADTVPEPAAWSLAAAGLGLLVARARTLKRKSRL